MKVRLRLPISGVEDALIETMTDWTRKNIVDPDEWEEVFDRAEYRLADIIGLHEDDEITVEVDLIKGTARMLLPKCPDIKFKPGQVYGPHLAEVRELDLFD